MTELEKLKAEIAEKALSTSGRTGEEVIAEFLGEPVVIGDFLDPIERDESMDRDYIPLPGGWEIQTKGKGSSFRICDTKDSARWLVADSCLHKVLLKMALQIRGATIYAPKVKP